MDESSSEKESLSQQKEEKLFAREKLRVVSWIARRLKRLRRVAAEYRSHYEKCLAWQAVQHEATLLQTNFFRWKRGMASLTVEDWETGKEKKIALDPSSDPQEELAKRFKQSRKLQRGVEPTLRMLAKTESEVETLRLQHEEAQGLADWIGLEAFKKAIQFTEKKLPQKVAKPKPAEPFYTFTTEAGLPIHVGKNARGNDVLTFRHAKGNDWWLHASGASGSHVVLRVPKGEEPDSESLKDALQLALYYSKARDQGEGEVAVTQKKYVTRYGNTPGKVQLSKVKNIYIKVDAMRLERVRRGKTQT